MKNPLSQMKISSLIAFVLLSAASQTVVFGSPNSQPGGNPKNEPEVSVPGLVSTSSDNGGMRTRADTDLPSSRYGAHIDLNKPSVTLEQVDAASLVLEPEQIGINRSVAVSPNTRAQRFINPDGSELSVLIIKSFGASGVSVHFRNFALADGEEVYVYGTAPQSIVLGPFTDKGPWGSGEFWSGTVDGDTIVIEFYKKNGESGEGFEIFEVSHTLAELDWRLQFNGPEVENCEVDASCNPVIENNAVGRFSYIKPSGKYVCTGTLLNDAAQDRIPYFLTADHCINSQTLAQTVEVYWFYQTTSCNSGVLRNWVQSPPGATLLAHQRGVRSDISLLRLQNNAPAGAFFSAWTSAAQSTGTRVFGLHHPDGYVPPRIPSYLRRSDGSVTRTSGTCLSGGYRIEWTSGLTEEGSSGSGLFTSNGHKLVGVLSCGDTACSNSFDNYSKFSEFYPEIQQYLNSPVPSAPVANPATFVASNSFRANWRTVSGATGYRLDVATNDSFTNYVTGYQNLNVGNNLTHLVSNLSQSTSYYYRVRAYNEHGTSGNSNVISVRTLSPTGFPSVITEAATSIDRDGARLNGWVYPHGYPTTVYFEYGTTTSYGSRTSEQTKEGNNYLAVFDNILGLRPNTTYHFRLVGTNQVGTRTGTDKTFTTAR